MYRWRVKAKSGHIIPNLVRPISICFQVVFHCIELQLSYNYFSTKMKRVSLFAITVNKDDSKNLTKFSSTKPDNPRSPNVRLTRLGKDLKKDLKSSKDISDFSQYRVRSVSSGITKA